MPKLASCDCGTCLKCYRRIAQRTWRAQRRIGVRLSKEAISRLRSKAGKARWNRRPAPDEVSEAELDRRALQNWNPEWGAREPSGGRMLHNHVTSQMDWQDGCVQHGERRKLRLALDPD